MLVHDYLIRSAERFPEKIALVHGGRRTSYSELLSAASSVSAWLRHAGVEKGDRVAILNDDPKEYISSYFGILMAGGIVVALNTDTSARTLGAQISGCGVSVAITQAKFMGHFRELGRGVTSLKSVAASGLKPSDAGDEGYALFDLKDAFGFPPGAPAQSVRADIAQVIYTSGTTGGSSAVTLRHSNLVANTASIIEYLKLGEDDSVMAVLPFFYSYGNSVMLTHIAAGGRLVANQNFIYPNIILGQMAAEEVTGFSGVPSTYAILLNRSALRRYKFPALRYMTQAGGAMPPRLAREMKAMFPEVDFYIMYGQTEASARLSYLEPHELLRKAGSVGKAIPGVRLEVLDENGEPVGPGETGEIVASGENIMAGYWREPEKTARVLRNGKLLTGDLARVDDEGFIYIVSRKSDIIKCGSHRIHPAEIEEALAEHAAVHESAVVGVEDEILGEALKALVVLKTGYQCSRTELLQHCKALLPSYKVPQHIDFIPELPKTSSGKIKRALLKTPSAPGSPGLIDQRSQKEAG
ncbi:MAG: class I adenylate-forming enzyme family protein [Thermodesulfobacteriota bacterium]|nr:MAG: class I adenylate-forming enzyme family protein [Thermodesulfobacteriota bacterium]